MFRKTLCLILALGLLLCGCAGAAPQTAPGEQTVVFTDALDREVRVGSPGRVAALLGSFAQIWMLAGGEVCATADDAWEDLALDLPEDAVNLGNTKDMSLELLLSARPDLVLASVNTRQNVEWRETLEAAGITVAYFDVADFQDYLELLDLFTQITGDREAYDIHGLQVRDRIDAVVEKSRERLAGEEGPTVLNLRASASSIRVKNSRGNVLGEMLKALGCVNIADVNDALLESLSMEYILAADPEYIFIAPAGDDPEGMRAYFAQLLESDPAWATLTAVKNDRVYFMDKTLFNLKPNHRWGEAYEILEEILREGQ